MIRNEITAAALQDSLDAAAEAAKSAEHVNKSAHDIELKMSPETAGFFYQYMVPTNETVNNDADDKVDKVGARKVGGESKHGLDSTKDTAVDTPRAGPMLTKTGAGAGSRTTNSRALPRVPEADKEGSTLYDVYFGDSQNNELKTTASNLPSPHKHQDKTAITTGKLSAMRAHSPTKALGKDEQLREKGEVPNSGDVKESMIAHITVIEEDNANNLRSGSSIYEDVEVRTSNYCSTINSFLLFSPWMFRVQTNLPHMLTHHNLHVFSHAIPPASATTIYKYCESQVATA